MTTSVDDATADVLERFQAQMAAKRSASLSGSQSARPSGDRRARGGLPPQPQTTTRDRRDAPRSNLAQAALAQLQHGVPPLESHGSLSRRSSGDSTVSSDSSLPRTWNQMPVRELNEIRQPRRYFSQRIRRVVYGSTYWSAPMRTPAQRARGLTEETVTVKPIDRKLLPVSELIKRIEEAQVHAARQEAEAKMAPIRARNRLLRMQRRGADEPADSDEDDGAALDNDHIDLMSLLDHRTLHQLKADFASRSKALSLQEFVDVMRRYLPVEDIGEVRLAANLCNFFGAVDVNGDGTMEWNEFTNFITDAGLSSTTSSGVVGGGGADSVRQDTVEEYRKSSLVDDHTWTQPLERAFYFDAPDHLLAWQTNAHAFSVFRGKKMSHLATVDGHTSELLSAEYISKFKWVATSANDRTIRFWDASDHYKPVRNLVVRSDHTQICMRWAHQQQLLFTATDQKQIKAWRIEKSNTMQSASSALAKDGSTSAFIASHAAAAAAHSNMNKLNHYTTEVVSTFAGQNDITLDLLVLDNMSSLASASLDTTIALFDVNTHARTSTLKGGHKKGVFQLAYNPGFHVLVSAGYEHSAIVWNPYVAQKICKLKGHYSPLIGVQCVPNSPQILTADEGGMIKVWDIRNFSCVQTIYVEDDKESRVDQLTAFVSLHTHKRVVSCSHKMFLHDSLTSSSFQAPHIADLEPTSRCIYNTASGTFISSSGSTIKIWNASSGVLERVYRGVVPDGVEVSALCLDDAQKKFITGDTGGSIRVFNYLNGTQMKHVTMASAREITSIEYIPQLKNILTTAWDGSISLWDENQEEGLQLIKRLKAAGTAAPTTGLMSAGLAPRAANNGSEIITSAYSENLTLFATGASSGVIQLYDYRSHVLVGELIGHASEITSMMFLDPYPMLVSSDNEGNICFWVVRPLVLTIGKCVLRLVNTVKGKPRLAGADGRVAAKANGSEICPVTSLAFWTNVDARTFLAAHFGDEGIATPPTPTAHVYAGDVNGVIRCWDIMPAIRRWNMLPFYSHDRLVPTGCESDGGADGVDSDPGALTEAEKRRSQQQIQANGLAAGTAANSSAIGGAHAHRHSDAESDAEEVEAESADSPSSRASTPAPATTRPSLPQLVANLAAENMSAFSARAEAVNRVTEIGHSLGLSSVEYEAALATIPGATARHWAVMKAVRQQQELAAEHDGDGDKAASSASPAQKVRHPLHRRRVILEDPEEAEEKVAVPDPDEVEPPIDSPAHAAPTHDVSIATRVLSSKLMEMAATTRPVITNPFSRGTAKLTPAAPKPPTAKPAERKESVPATDDDASVPSDEVGVSADSDLGAARRPAATLPSIPLLPLSKLAPGSTAFPGSDAASFMPKSILRHSRTNDYVEYRRTHRELMNDLERHARARTTPLQPGDIKLVHWWIAHSDSIRDMHIVHEPVRHVRGQVVPRDPRSSALLSTAFDKKICLWDRKGASLGHLQQGRTDDTLAGVSDTTGTGGAAVSRVPLKPDWSFQSDVRGRYERSQHTARQVLNRLSTARAGTARTSAHPSRRNTAASRRRELADLDGVTVDYDFSSGSDSDAPSPRRHRAGDTFLTELDELAAGIDLGQPHLTVRHPSPPAKPRPQNLAAKPRRR